MISCAVQPSSAIRRPRVFRKPWGLQSIGNPAALIVCRMNCEKPAARGMVEGAAQFWMKANFDAHASLASRIRNARCGFIDLTPSHPVNISTRGADVQHQAV